MPDLYTLFAKIQSLPRKRIAEVEDFVDFLTLRRAGKTAKPSLQLEKMINHLDNAERPRYVERPA